MQPVPLQMVYPSIIVRERERFKPNASHELGVRLFKGPEQQTARKGYKATNSILNQAFAMCSQFARDQVFVATKPVVQGGHPFKHSASLEHQPNGHD
jgi:hypothetical protein